MADSYFNLNVGGQTYQARLGENGQYGFYDPSGNQMSGWSASQDDSGIGVFQNGGRVANVTPASEAGTGTWAAVGDPSISGAIEQTYMPNAIAGVNPGDYAALMDIVDPYNPETQTGITEAMNAGLITITPDGRIQYNPMPDYSTFDPDLAGRLYNAVSGNNPEMFQPDLYPTSSGTNTSTSYSGLPSEYLDQLMQGLMPELMRSIQGMPQAIDEYTGKASQMYEGMGRRLLDDAMPGILNNLAGRNVLNSSVASDAISKTATNIIPMFTDAALQAGMKGAEMKANIPSILGNIANLGRVSESSAEGTSESSNPLAPYELLSNFTLNY